MNPDDYDEDGNNIVPCPLCLNIYCPSKDNGKCPEEDAYIRCLEERDNIKINFYKCSSSSCCGTNKSGSCKCNIN